MRKIDPNLQQLSSNGSSLNHNQCAICTRVFVSPTILEEHIVNIFCIALVRTNDTSAENHRLLLGLVPVVTITCAAVSLPRGRSPRLGVNISNADSRRKDSICTPFDVSCARDSSTLAAAAIALFFIILFLTKATLIR